MHLGLVWEWRSDLLVARLVGVLFGGRLRAHPSGVYAYLDSAHGAWQRVEELPAIFLREVESAVPMSQIMFKSLLDANPAVPRTWVAVFDFLRLQNFAGAHALSKTAFTLPRGGEVPIDTAAYWWRDAGASLWQMAPRLTGGGRAKATLEAFGTWFKVPKPAPTNIVSFADASVVVSEDVNHQGVLTQVQKSPGSDCYYHIPVRLNFKPSDESVRRIRRFLCTAWAGNEEGRRYYTADEVLSLSRTTMAQKIKIVQGRGGDGKSLLGRLRANLYGEGHRFVSPSVFFELEEFRKQGGRSTALYS